MSTQTLLYLTLAVIVAILFALFQYSILKKNSSKKNLLFAALRFISVFSILMLLINPKFEKINYYSEKPNLIVAVDNSSSIAHLKQDQNALQFLQSIKNNAELNKKFTIDYFSFGNDLVATDSFHFNESQTNIDKAFSELSQIYKNTNSPMVLISDGNQTFGNDYSYVAPKIKQAIYPVILGDTIKYTDLKLQQLNVNKYTFLKNKFPVEAIITYNGNETITSKFVINSGGATVYTQNLTFSKSENSKILQINLPANNVGVQAYKAQITPLKNEKNTINNYKNFAVEVIDQKTNVAIVSDFLHPDLGALKKSIESNEQRSVSILNPNNYFLQKDDFQLVILYQPNNNFKAVFDEINKTSANYFLVLGSKTDYQFLNSIQNNIKHEITNETEEYQASLNTNYATFIIDNLDFESFPPLLTTFGNANFSVPFETILYKQVGSITTENALLATLETNNKREAILFGEDIWKWRAQSYLNQKTFQNFDNFIGKIIQYLASNKRKNRLNVDYQSFYQGNSNVIVKAQFFNKNYEFDTNATLNLLVKEKNTSVSSTIPFILSGNNYQADLSHLPAGNYQFTVKATNENISKSGSFQILEYYIEQQFLNANYKKLEAVAAKTNGKSYFINNYENIFTDLLEDKRFATIQKSNKNIVPLIDWKYLLGLILLSLAIEWFLRKYNGLI